MGLGVISVEQWLCERIQCALVFADEMAKSNGDYFANRFCLFTCSWEVGGCRFRSLAQCDTHDNKELLTLSLF